MSTDDGQATGHGGAEPGVGDDKSGLNRDEQDKKDKKEDKPESKQGKGNKHSASDEGANKESDATQDEEDDKLLRSPLPSNPTAWTIDKIYERDSVSLTKWLFSSVFDLGYATRTVQSDALGDRVVVGKAVQCRDADQVLETSRNGYVAAQLSQGMADFTIRSEGVNKALSL